MEQEKIVEEITALKGSMKTIFSRVDTIDDKLDAIEQKQDIMHEMNTNIKLIALNQENQGKEITAIKSDVKDLKEKPAKKWNTLETVIFSAIAGGLATYFLTALLTKIFGG